MNAETTLSLILLAGAVLLAVGLIWLLIAAFRVRWTWGLAVFALLPVAAPIFLARHFRAAYRPSLVMLLGLVVGLSPIVYSRLAPVDLGPLVRLVDGEVHIVLTGWDRKDYSILKARPDVVVLKMANPDVTDETLDFLAGMSRLKDLDLNETKISDVGLAKLAGLPALESLRLKGTAITGDGFDRTLGAMPRLKNLDLRGTKVGRDRTKAWKSAQAGRHVME